MEYEVEGSRPRGRPKRTWKEVVREDCQARKLNKEDAMDRCKWRKMIKEARWPGWVWVGECFFWYRPTRVDPDKRPLNGCCCCCINNKDYNIQQCIHDTILELRTKILEKFHVCDIKTLQTSWKMLPLYLANGRSYAYDQGLIASLKIGSTLNSQLLYRMANGISEKQNTIWVHQNWLIFDWYIPKIAGGRFYWDTV